MAKRCKKHLNFTVTECTVLKTTHVFVDGQFKETLNSNGKEFGTVTVRCEDCGLVETCQKSGLPKWVKEVCKRAGIVL
jgi:hypothetical protein